MAIFNLEKEEDLNTLLLKHPLVVVDFYSEDCPPCEKLAPIFLRLSKQYTDVVFIKIFRQQFRPLAQMFNVTGSPTLLFFYHGTPQEVRLSGETEETAIIKQLDVLLLKENIKHTSTSTRRVIEVRDLGIIGTGPAGLTASIYASRYHLDHAIIGELSGGLMTASHKICNYPSENEISGMDLTQKIADHVLQLGVKPIVATVSKIKKTPSGFNIILSNNDVIQTKSILIATGTHHKHLNLPNEEKFVGRGISYCATCDAAFFKGKTVAVVGGSDSANTASLYLAGIAKHVYQIYRGSELRGETAWIEQIKNEPKIQIVTETNIIAVHGESQLNEIELDRPFMGNARLALDGLFVEIGSDPDNKLIKQLEINTDQKGYIVVGSDQKTNVANVWAAGDITNGSNNFRQIITACSEGAIAAQSIFYSLKKNN